MKVLPNHFVEFTLQNQFVVSLTFTKAYIVYFMDHFSTKLLFTCDFDKFAFVYPSVDKTASILLVSECQYSKVCSRKSEPYSFNNIGTWSLQFNRIAPASNFR